MIVLAEDVLFDLHHATLAEPRGVSVGGTQAVMMVSSVAMGMRMRFSQVMDGVMLMGMIVWMIMGIVRTMKVVVGMIVPLS